MREEVVRAQLSVVAAQEKVRHEEALLQDGVSRLAALQEEGGGRPAKFVQPTAPAHFARVDDVAGMRCRNCAGSATI